MNKIVAIGSTNFVKSSLLSLFCPFVETKNKNQVFQQVTLYLESMPNSIEFNKNIFLHE